MGVVNLNEGQGAGSPSFLSPWLAPGMVHFSLKAFIFTKQNSGFEGSEVSGFFFSSSPAKKRTDHFRVVCAYRLCNLFLKRSVSVVGVSCCKYLFIFLWIQYYVPLYYSNFYKANHKYTDFSYRYAVSCSPLLPISHSVESTPVH